MRHQVGVVEESCQMHLQNVKRNSKDIDNIFMVLKELIEKQAKPAARNKIGFRRKDENEVA